MKKFLFVQSAPPHGSIAGQEGLDALLMGSAFAECSLLLLEDGVYQLLASQQTASLVAKDYSVTYKALRDYGVDNIACCQSHLDERGLKVEDFVIPVKSLTDEEVTLLMQQNDIIIGF